MRHIPLYSDPSCRSICSSCLPSLDVTASLGASKALLSFLFESSSKSATDDSAATGGEALSLLVAVLVNMCPRQSTCHIGKVSFLAGESQPVGPAVQVLGARFSRVLCVVYAQLLAPVSLLRFGWGSRRDTS
ncbi:hypothetical protein cyc_08862 [Cyclospora cayetanensis]|uniref:Uncharacterized protein n=1 Tax=Cyclospora cayetanensis TaxID=88456 RepID=A0A1D3DA89_9EIME|nr:hypothetical protein cyc_08862 [Cyclospora cayetanensis]